MRNKCRWRKAAYITYNSAQRNKVEIKAHQQRLAMVAGAVSAQPEFAAQKGIMPHTLLQVNAEIHAVTNINTIHNPPNTIIEAVHR